MAVAHELRARDKSVKLVYIGERKGKFAHITKDSGLFDELHYVSAGKLRRYHGESLVTRLLDFKTIFLNIRDIFKLTIGLFQAYFLLKKLKADSILLKGGFVCVPVAVAANLNKTPYITHDSDALPGLSNRIAARWAKYHATAMPAKYYSYPQKSIKVVGVPTDSRFRPYTDAEQAILRQKLGVDKNAQVLLITGGSNGARRMNQAIIEVLPDLMKTNKDLYVFHQIGAGNEDQSDNFPEELKKRINFFGYSSEIFHMSALADVVITRAGASAVADLAFQSKACIIIPNPYLTGGHQLENAKVYKDSDAAVIIQESEMMNDRAYLLKEIDDLLNNSQRRHDLATNLHKLTPKISAAKAIANLLEEISK